MGEEPESEGIQTGDEIPAFERTADPAGWSSCAVAEQSAPAGRGEAGEER